MPTPSSCEQLKALWGAAKFNRWFKRWRARGDIENRCLAVLQKERARQGRKQSGRFIDQAYDELTSLRRTFIEPGKEEQQKIDEWIEVVLRPKKRKRRRVTPR